MPGFFDGFFFVTAFIVAILVAIDWAIGTKGQARVKERVGDFWTVIQYRRLADLYVSLLIRFSSWLGEKAPSAKFLIALVINVILVSVLFAVRAGQQLPNTLANLWSQPGGVFALGSVAFIVLTCGSIPIFSAVRILRRDLVEPMGWKRVLQVFAKVLASAWFFGNVVLSVFSAILFLTLWFSGFSFDLAVLIALLSSLSPQVEFLQFLVLIGLFALVILFSLLILAAVLMVPTGGLLILLFVLVFLKATRPVLEPTVSLVLARLYEHKQGVLTQFSIGLGVIAKLAQEASKHLG